MTDRRPGGATLASVLINLDDRPDRLARATRRLGRYGIRFERQPAVGPDQVAASGLRSANPRLLPGELACIASHLAVYRRIVDQDLPLALVLEDDVLPVINFGRRLAHAVGAAPSRAALIQVGWLDLTPLRARPMRGLGRSTLATAVAPVNVVEAGPFRLGTHAYCATPEFARLALEHCNPAFAPLDEMLHQLTSEPTLGDRCFVHRPSLALQDTSPSDIRDYRPVAGYRSWRRILP